MDVQLTLDEAGPSEATRGLAMTGPEHFREAEGIVNQLLTGEIGASPAGEDLLDRDQLLALAQVHATLANAAATALGSGEDLDARDYKAWYEVAGVKPALWSEPA